MQPYWKCFKAGRYFLLPTIHWSFFQGRLFIFEQDDAEPYCIYSTERLKLKVCVLLNQKQVKGLVGIVSWKDFRLFEYVEHEDFHVSLRCLLWTEGRRMSIINFGTIIKTIRLNWTEGTGSSAEPPGAAVSTSWLYIQAGDASVPLGEPWLSINPRVWPEWIWQQEARARVYQL